MTPEQSKLAAEHVDFTLSIVRGGRLRMWSEAESTALELLCKAARWYDPDKGGSFKGYLSANLNRWLLSELRIWTRHRRVHRLEFIPTAGQDIERIADTSRSAEDTWIAAETAARELREVTPRTVAIARFINCGFERQEVATVLRVSPSAVSHALHDGRERIIRYRKVA